MAPMEEKEPTVGQHAPRPTAGDRTGGDLPVESPGVTDLEKIERVYR